MTEWVDVDTTKKSQVVQCKLWTRHTKCSSDGSIYRDGDRWVTTTYLPLKLSKKEYVSLRHPDTGIDEWWFILSRGRPRWLNKNGQILWGQ